MASRVVDGQDFGSGSGVLQTTFSSFPFELEMEMFSPLAIFILLSRSVVLGGPNGPGWPTRNIRFCIVTETRGSSVQ